MSSIVHTHAIQKEVATVISNANRVYFIHKVCVLCVIARYMSHLKRHFIADLTSLSLIHFVSASCIPLIVEAHHRYAPSIRIRMGFERCSVIRNLIVAHFPNYIVSKTKTNIFAVTRSYRRISPTKISDGMGWHAV